MSSESTEQFTRLIGEAQKGDAEAANKLLPLVYEQLRKLAQQRMAGQRTGHTLQATALVHEAYLRLVGDDQLRWSSRSHFFFAAAEAMRCILIDHARARGALKRGGDRQHVPLQNVLDLAAEEQFAEILALDEALLRLEEKVSPSAAAIVRLRFYGGLNVDETAEAMGVSPRTVERHWTFARAWLIRELDPEGQ